MTKHAQAHPDSVHTSHPAHADTTGQTANDHHAQSHSHGSHTGIGVNDHHNQNHTMSQHTDGPYGPPGPSYAAGQYLEQQGRFPGTNQTQAQGFLFVYRFFVHATVTIDQLEMWLWQNGNAGSKMRFGIWDDSAGHPHTVLFDSGDVAADSGAPKSLVAVINAGAGIQLTAGWYWLGMWSGPATADGNAAVTCPGVGSQYDGYEMAAPRGAQGSSTQYRQAAPAGYGAGTALPTDPNSFVYNGGVQTPLIWCRVKSVP